MKSKRRPMKTTSHFIGIKLKSEYFVSLYTELQKLLWEKRDILEFQNILSIHITLYYLPPTLSSDHLHQIQRFKDYFWRKKVTLTGYSYFGDSTHWKLYYLKPDNSNEYLNTYNHELRTIFQEFNTIIDNTYSFIPHITLFKVRDWSAYEDISKEVEGILNNYLWEIENVDIYESFELFQVNSKFAPEIQISVPFND
jgi:2'-5' RNA ligase